MMGCDGRFADTMRRIAVSEVCESLGCSEDCPATEPQMKVSTRPVKGMFDAMNAHPEITAMEEVLAYIEMGNGRTAQITIRIETDEGLWDLRNRKASP